MSRTVGVVALDHIALGLVENHRLSGPLREYPEDGSGMEGLRDAPAKSIVEGVVEQIRILAAGQALDAIGVGIPGVVKDGIIEDAPDLPQVKGMHLEVELWSAFRTADHYVPILILNNADALAAGIAVSQGHLGKFLRVWTLGNGVGFGRYPRRDGIWDGGHTVVSLDPAERYCRCGGVGHLEGILGQRSIRLRFMDLEPEEVFENAAQGDRRCRDFVRYWHRALAAGIATSIHMDGPGRFFIAGRNSRHVDLARLNEYLNDMVKIGPLEGSLIELFTASSEMAVLGAAVSAEHTALGLS